MGLAWTWVLVAAIAVGLPGAAWWLSRNLGPPRQWPVMPGYGHLDRWLAGHYRLGALDRWRVEEAVFGGRRALREPRLREAARELAAEVWSGRLRPPWVVRWGAGFLGALGLMWTAFGWLNLATGHLGGVGVLYIVEGVAGVVLGVAGMTWWVPSQMRRNLERAMRLNRDDADNRSAAP